jgi:alpha-mannosidase
LRLTLLRSPVSPDPDADRGPEHFSFALYPHDGDWKSALTVRHGYDYNYKLRSMQVRAHAGALPAEHSFISVKGDNVVFTAVKKAEDTNALIVRFYEWAGKDGDVQITVPRGATSATFTNLMEKPEGAALPLSDSSRITVPVHPYSIDTAEFAYPHSEPATQAMQ